MILPVWNRYHCFALLAASVIFLLTHNLIFFVLAGTGSIMWLIFLSRDELKKLAPFGGWANRVTAIRYIAIMMLAMFYSSLTNLQIALWLAAIIPFDGIDGYLARKRNEKTEMGAYFDMETDVLFVCIASCILFVRGLSGYEILIIAFFRYIYVVLVFVLGYYNIKEQRTKIGPIIAVYVFIAVTLAFLVSEIARIVLIYSAIVLLIVSFAYSFYLIRANFRK
jgi:phosphatidylglycerophosphate synthase